MPIAEAQKRRQSRVEARRQQAQTLYQAGVSIAEIAKRLDKTERTVKTYLNGSLQNV